MMTRGRTRRWAGGAGAEDAERPTRSTGRGHAIPGGGAHHGDRERDGYEKRREIHEERPSVHRPADGLERRPSAERHGSARRAVGVPAGPRHLSGRRPMESPAVRERGGDSKTRGHPRRMTWCACKKNVPRAARAQHFERRRLERTRGTMSSRTPAKTKRAALMSPKSTATKGGWRCAPAPENVISRSPNVSFAPRKNPPERSPRRR